MVTKITVTINFTKFVNGKKKRTWTENRTLCTTPEGRRYIWWLKRKLPVGLIDGEFYVDVHVRDLGSVENNLPKPSGYADNGGGRPRNEAHG